MSNLSSEDVDFSRTAATDPENFTLPSPQCETLLKGSPRMPRSEKGLKLTSKGEKMNHITTEQKGQTTKIDRFNAPFAAPEWLAAFAAQQVTHKVLTRLSWKSLGLFPWG